MNENQIRARGFSNPASLSLYRQKWPDEPLLQVQYNSGCGCGACSFYAIFDMDWGLCCHPKSRHHLETVKEHFTCPSFVLEGWGPHSFDERGEYHCLCGGLLGYWPPGGVKTWAVWKQDHIGVRWQVRRGFERRTAERIARELESRGHKETYWIEPEPVRNPPPEGTGGPPFEIP